MSAVGLMLLEDPKARARAEARIRNGTAKRRSFFGKSSAAPPSRNRPNLPPTIEDVEDDSPIVRPPTSLSQSIALPHRKKAESISDRSSSRNSFFGRKNSFGESSVKSGSSGRASHISAAVSTHSGAISTHAGAVSNHSREPTSIKEDYHRDQPAAYPPCHCQLAAHAVKSHSAALPTVDERKSPIQSGFPPTHMKPQVQVNGVKAEDWATAKLEPEGDPESTQSRAMSPVDPDPPRIPSTARISLFDDTIFQSVAETTFDPEDGARALENYRTNARTQKPFSTMVARNSLMFPEEPILQTPGNVPDANPLDSFAEDTLHDPRGIAGVAIPSVQRKDAEPKRRTENTAFFGRPDDHNRLKKPSLPISERRPEAKKSQASLASVSEASVSSSQLDLPMERTVVPDAIPRSHSSASAGKSPALSFSSNVRESTIFADSTWEDDIDFAYEQEADATCDFNWDSKARNHVDSYQSDGGVRVSENSCDTGASPTTHDSTRESSYENSRDSTRGSARSIHRDSRVLSSESTASDRENARGSSVGHRGFAAARNSTGDKLAKNAKLPPLNIPTRSPQGDSSAPLSSIADSDEETPKSPLTPGGLDFPMPPGTTDIFDFPMPPTRSDSLGFPMPPSHRRNSNSNVSESESWRSSSWKRRSSSHGSYESLTVASTAPSTAPSSGASTRDAARWSMASTSSIPSVPSLINNRLKRASSVSKAIISPPLESLIAEEETFDQLDNGRFAPDLQPFPDRESFVIRRPRTSGDRRLLQAAGRAVQRQRPSPANSSSRGLQEPEAYDGRNESSGHALRWL